MWPSYRGNTSEMHQTAIMLGLLGDGGKGVLGTSLKGFLYSNQCMFIWM